MCDNHRECEAARRRGFGDRAAPRHAVLDWHGEWRGQELVRTLIAALGVEVTVLDAEDAIVAFSGGPRLFERTDDMLGASVYGCHPAEVREAVREVLDALRAGEAERTSVATLPDGGSALTQFVARRDASGRYLGCMELTRRAG